MRPYLAILIDSFREAVHSRVLWVVLLCITLVFLLLLPISLGEQMTTGLHDEDMIGWPQLAQQLLKAGEEQQTTPSPAARYVWDKLEADVRARLPEVVNSNLESEKFMGAARAIRRGLTKQVNDPEWYDREALKGVKLRREGRDLLQKLEEGKELSPTEKLPLNRLALEGIFPESIALSAAKSASLGYFPFGSRQLPLTHAQVQELLPPYVVLFVDYTFGIFGILAALLMTASIIPQMFEPGSLHLLLSKPISRSLLYLTKFAGGCIALIMSSYFALLLWLLLGTRLAIWDSRVLAAVAVYTFVFAIYYSVTALQGLIFRNTIVSVVIGIAFWGICFVLGVVQTGMNTFLIGYQRIQKLAVAEDTILGVFPHDELPAPGMAFVVRQYRPSTATWDKVYRSQAEGPNAMNQTYPELGPFYDAAHDQLISLQGNRFRGRQAELSVAPRSESWPRTHGANLPPSAVGIALDRDSQVVAVALDGIYRSTRNVALGDGGTKVMGFSLPWGASSSFEKVTSGDWPLAAQPISMAIDPQSDAIAVYARGEVGVWDKQSDGRYLQIALRTLPEEERGEMQLVMAGGRLLLAPRDGRMLVLNAATLESMTEYQPEGKDFIRQLRASPQGEEIAAIFTHGVLYRFDTQTNEFTRARVPWQSSISAIAYDQQGSLLVAHDANYVSRCNLAEGNAEPVCTPQLSSAELFYYYGVVPTYTVLPQPGELYRTMLYLLTGKKSDPAPQNQNNAAEPDYVERNDPWKPVWSGAIFLVVMLGIGCLYMQRMEF